MEIVKRGYEPKDAMEFGSKAAEKLNAAGQELVFLLNRGYDVKSASATTTCSPSASGWPWPA